MDDWSLLPSRNAVSEPAPNPQSPMTTTNPSLPDSTRPRQAPPPAPTPMPAAHALDPTERARQLTQPIRGRRPETPTTAAHPTTTLPQTNLNTNRTPRPLTTPGPSWMTQDVFGDGAVLRRRVRRPFLCHGRARGGCLLLTAQAIISIGGLGAVLSPVQAGNATTSRSSTADVRAYASTPMALMTRCAQSSPRGIKELSSRSLPMSLRSRRSP